MKVGDLVIRKVSPHAGDHLNSLQEASAYQQRFRLGHGLISVSYTHLRAHET